MIIIFLPLRQKVNMYIGIFRKECNKQRPNPSTILIATQRLGQSIREFAHYHDAPLSFSSVENIKKSHNNLIEISKKFKEDIEKIVDEHGVVNPYLYANTMTVNKEFAHAIRRLERQIKKKGGK